MAFRWLSQQQSNRAIIVLPSSFQCEAIDQQCWQCPSKQEEMPSRDHWTPRVAWGASDRCQASGVLRGGHQYSVPLNFSQGLKGSERRGEREEGDRQS